MEEQDDRGIAIIRPEVISIQPGDFLVLRCQEGLRPEQMKWLESTLQTFVESIGHPDLKTMVLDPSLSLEVHRKESDALRTEETMP